MQNQRLRHPRRLAAAVAALAAIGVGGAGVAAAATGSHAHVQSTHTRVGAVPVASTSKKAPRARSATPAHKCTHMSAHTTPGTAPS